MGGRKDDPAKSSKSQIPNLRDPEPLDLFLLSQQAAGRATGQQERYMRQLSRVVSFGFGNQFDPLIKLPPLGHGPRRR